MASVFLSYDRDDVRTARPIVAALEKAGHSVWWDQHITSGAQYSKIIEEALSAANAVVVLWSAQSVDSPWVRDEAAAGRDNGKLVPVSLDGAEPPMGFRQYQTIKLGKWNGRGSPPALKTLVADIESVSARHPPEPVAAPSSGPPPSGSGPNWRVLLLSLAGIALLLVAVLLSGKLGSPAKAPPAVVVVAADSSASSQRMARGMLAALGSLQGAGSTQLRLLEPQSAGQANLKVAVDANSSTANVSISTTRDQAILWSSQFKLSGDGHDEEMLAAVTGRILGCAAEATADPNGPLQEEIRQLYLNSCVAADGLGWDVQPILAQLRKVVEAAPKFEPARARLLDLESIGLRYSAPFEPAEELRSTLRGDIAVTRKVFPDLAEIGVAEVAVRPDLPLLDAIAKLDKLALSHPDNISVFRARAEAMSAVGRVYDAAADADRAAQLDKLSPTLRAASIRALVYTGDLAKARSQLARAMQLWPDADAIKVVRDEIDLRYGDFEQALRRSGARMDAGILTYIKARREPTLANQDAFMTLAKTRELNAAQKLFVLQALPEFGRVEDLYALVARWPTDRTLLHSTDLLFAPWNANFRRDPRFIGLARRLGLVAYWQASGKWPNFCSEPDTPYSCEAEAAGSKRQAPSH